jgi:hypothetical protein
MEPTDNSSSSSAESPVQFTAVQFAAADKEPRVQKTGVKIRLPGEAVQNTETEDKSL